jgi:hypothetical protein
MAEETVEATTAAQAIFYNMTGQDVQMQVNNVMSSQETVNALPTASPYTPNYNTKTYTRVNATPQPSQFGTVNNLLYESLSGLGFMVQVTINVDVKGYPVTTPLFILMFSTAVVVVSPYDSNPYMGHSGDTITVKSGSETL